MVISRVPSDLAFTLIEIGWSSSHHSASSSACSLPACRKSATAARRAACNEQSPTQLGLVTQGYHDAMGQVHQVWRGNRVTGRSCTFIEKTRKANEPHATTPGAQGRSDVLTFCSGPPPTRHGAVDGTTAGEFTPRQPDDQGQRQLRPPEPGLFRFKPPLSRFATQGKFGASSNCDDDARAGRKNAESTLLYAQPIRPAPFKLTKTTSTCAEKCPPTTVCRDHRRGVGRVVGSGAGGGATEATVPRYQPCRPRGTPGDRRSTTRATAAFGAMMQERKRGNIPTAITNIVNGCKQLPGGATASAPPKP